MSPWHSLFTVLYHWMLHKHVLHHHDIPSLFTVSCCWMLHRHVSPWCSFFLYSVMPLDVTQCCITMMFPLSLHCHAVGCYAVLYHHGIPSFFTLSCCWMLRSVVSPWYSLFLYTVMLLDVTQCCITMVFPLSLHCHAVGCYAVLYHHGIPSFFTLSCCWMLRSVVSPWYSLFLYTVMLLDVTHSVLYHHDVPSFFTVSCCWMLHIQCCITMMFPLSLQCHAVGCYTFSVVSPWYSLFLYSGCFCLTPPFVAS